MKQRKCRGPALALCTEQVPTDLPAHLGMSSSRHWITKAVIYILAQNNHSPGRNDMLEDDKPLAGSSDHLKWPQLSTVSASVPLSRQEQLLGQVDKAKGPGAHRCLG